MTNWFTSDWHFGHEKMQQGLRGKAFTSPENHDTALKENIFNTVKPGDNLYFLGDAFWKWDSKKVERFMTDLKKHKISLHWILGNHDRLSWTRFSCVKWVGHIKDIVIEKQPITLCHYPMLTWNRSHYGAWNLHGHIHIDDSTSKKLPIKMPLYPLGKQLNVNVEYHSYKPISFEEVDLIMKGYEENWDYIKKEDRRR